MPILAVSQSSGLALEKQDVRLVALRFVDLSQALERQFSQSAAMQEIQRKTVIQNHGQIKVALSRLD